MATYTIDKIEYDGNVYELQDNKSGYTTNVGTVTSVQVQATSPVVSSTNTAQSSSLNTTISLANNYGDTKNPYGAKSAGYVLAGPSTGSAAAPTFRQLSASEIIGYTNAQTQQNVSVYNWIQNLQQDVDDKVQDVKLDGTSIVNGSRVANISSQDILANLQIEARDVGFQAPVQTSYLENASDVEEALVALDTATASHTHGNIANGGTISSTAVSPASTDYILISDTSNSGKIERGIAIGTDTTKFLRNDGTWQTISTEDTKVTNTLATTTKYYVTGTTSASTNTGTQSFDSGIYATTTAGQLNATTYKVNEQVTLQWNSTDSTLDFIFA